MHLVIYIYIYICNNMHLDVIQRGVAVSPSGIVRVPHGQRDATAHLGLEQIAYKIKKKQ